MTINIDELRRLAQAATPGPWKACRNHECYEGAYFEIAPEDEAEYAAKPFTRIEARTGVVAAAHDLFEFNREDAEFIAADNPAVIEELLDRLEAAEKERDNVAQQLVRSEVGRRSISKAHEAVTSRLSSLADENTALRAKIAEMEKQEPVWFIDERGEPKKYHKSKADYCKYGGLDLLYALPGAKGEDK